MYNEKGMTKRGFLKLGAIVIGSVLVGNGLNNAANSLFPVRREEYSFSEKDIERAADVMLTVYKDASYPIPVMGKAQTYDAWVLCNHMQKGYNVDDALGELYGKEIIEPLQDRNSMKEEREAIIQSLRLAGKGNDPTNSALARRDRRKQDGLDEYWHTNSSRWKKTTSVPVAGKYIEYYRLENVGVLGQLYRHFCHLVE